MSLQYNQLLSLPFEEYQKIDAVNASSLKIIKDQSPWHLKYLRDSEVKEEDTDAQLFGNLFHKMLLEGEAYKDKFLIEPVFSGLTKDGKESTRSGEAQAKRKHWWSTLPAGSIVIPEKFQSALIGMMNSILAHPFTSNLLKTGVKEQTILWKDSETGLDCKGRLDFLSSFPHAVDFKTTTNAEPKAFAREIYKYDYHIQAAHYASGGKHTKLFSDESFIIVAIEKNAPYAISIHILDAYGLGVGDQWRSHLMERYKRCLNENKWPCYPIEGKVAMPPEWSVFQENV